MIIVDGKPILNPLVCDTNIWYHIADGQIPLEKVKPYNLIGTGVNISEFATTDHLINNPYLLVNALKAMLKYHKLIMKSNFMDHMLSLFDDKIEIDNTTNDILMNGFLVYMTIDPIEDVPAENIEKATVQLAKIKAMKNELVAPFNEKIPEVREIIKKTGGKKEHRKKDFTLSHRKLFSEMLGNFSKHYYKKDLKIELDDENWKMLDFFIRAWDEYFRNMELLNNMKLHDNDFADLFNLVYVQPGVRYTTMEKKWKNLFKNDEVLTKYFIDL